MFKTAMRPLSTAPLQLHANLRLVLCTLRVPQKCLWEVCTPRPQSCSHTMSAGPALTAPGGSYQKCHTHWVSAMEPAYITHHCHPPPHRVVPVPLGPQLQSAPVLGLLCLDLASTARDTAVSLGSGLSGPSLEPREPPLTLSHLLQGPKLPGAIKKVTDNQQVLLSTARGGEGALEDRTHSLDSCTGKAGWPTPPKQPGHGALVCSSTARTAPTD